MKITHDQQKIAWENEHKNPQQFTNLAGVEVSGGVESFWKYLEESSKIDEPKGLEIGCGKGRNTIWLAKNGASMDSFDFSTSAISEAKKRITEDIKSRINFFEHDIIKPWPLLDNRFDFVIDCFVSTDVEGEENRKFMIDEIYRVLKPEGLFFLYTNSTKSNYYQDQAKETKVEEVNAYCYPDIEKFEKVYSQEELDIMYSRFDLKKSEIFERKSSVNGQDVSWEHIWRVYQKK